MKLIIASANAHKVAEITELIPQNSDLNILSLKDVYSPVPDIPETGTTFEENSIQKAEWVRRREQCWVLADDSGLEVDALNLRPGIYSARYAGTPCDDKKNNRKLLEEMAGVPAQNRTARYRAVITLLSPEKTPFIYTGVCEGHIQSRPMGAGGFGYDPLFIPRGYTQSFGELAPEIKQKISHRSMALEKLRKNFPLG
ncbi:MAG: RdgB/HAM1 family non-canonical purine NTP pyrophosphatase [Fibrobacterota bacterium]